ncbi:glycosyltransferase family 4 protein [Chryseobacterium limigenitum]|uniref:Glycosyltransferase involved in cell wall bisynthesis n=1 Tax=Chryseobacterium limigenitum TaxID=1612149 RepID=A0A1K2IHM0_9FLAO|nr:glycosyltransferase family 4 protein [Chryseobacterium limigenitum]SFZ91163.1 Glycosyltransferase involved in cell wall bisynthesis [Chryseobacterium limigenitum]
MKIGLTQNDYPIRRNILNKVSGFEYIFLRKNNNLFHSLSTVKKILFRKKSNIEGKYFFYQKPKIDILHLYNDINYSSQKWVTSFETLVPRFTETKNDHQKTEPQHIHNTKTENALKQISRKNCLGIISISQASANIQLELLKNYPQFQEVIKNKLSVIHPSQEVIPRDSEEVYKNIGVFNFIFVGTQFHLKGGVEMIEVLKKLRQKYNFKLTIVSSFKTDHYVTKVTEKEAQETKEMLKKEEWIDIFENIPNEKVLDLIKESHVGLLPTWSDTYGFSVLEMQAAGVPVVTTDIRALPEINNENCGWLIHLPQNRLKQALYFTNEQRDELKRTLKLQLENILEDIFTNPQQLLEKSKNSLERIKENHDPFVFSEKLNTIYSKKINIF